ncbi:hypothetical protein JW979_16255 [bacterium]|nr:hypothetical protein [candidate division CSSED10-310 bacterium]
MINNERSDGYGTLIYLLTKAVDVISDIAEEQGILSDNSPPFYPPDITPDELKNAALYDRRILRFDTYLRRDSHGQLIPVPFTQKHRHHCHQLRDIFDNAKLHVAHPEFSEYLNTLTTWLDQGSETAYFAMQQQWLKTVNLPFLFPLVLDETYADTVFGLKGSMDAAVFIEDRKMTSICQKYLDYWYMFVTSINLPGNPLMIKPSYPKVYRAHATSAGLLNLELKAWNLPNNFALRQSSGSYQILIQETIQKSFYKDILPLLHSLFEMNSENLAQDSLLTVFHQMLLYHELAHNIGCYEMQRNLMIWDNVFEELKANILPLQFILHARDMKWMESELAEAAIMSYLALDLMDCLLARSVKSRVSYDYATKIQFSYLIDKGALKIEDSRILIDYQRFGLSNAVLLSDCLEILSIGDPEQAKRYTDRYLYRKELEYVIDLAGSILGNSFKSAYEKPPHKSLIGN